MSDLSEKAFEDYLEGFFAREGYEIGASGDFSAAYAIDEARFWEFLENTQEGELTKLGAEYKIKILKRLEKVIEKEGVIGILQNGLMVENAKFRLYYPLPSASDGAEVRSNFAKNRFSLIRQVPFEITPQTKPQTIDAAVFINGLAVATFELKNAFTHQSAKINATAQYRARNVKEPIFHFGRCLVYFALDTDEAYMSTKIEGEKTIFLPFNKGFNGGAGNPANENGFKTEYVLEDVFTKEHLAEIIDDFVLLSGEKNAKLSQKWLIFPRYHQLDAVRKIVEHTKAHGVGQRYLIQHSAGSGKSNTILWLAFRLTEISPKFDSVIVVTDRRLLDKQQMDNFGSFTKVKDLVKHANRSGDLRSALENGKKIIVTTIQKFSYINDDIGDLSDKKFAVIIDEAHSSQSGVSSDNLNAALGDEDYDTQDKILEAIKGKKLKKNASYFAFTATPKNTTLEKFGIKREDGSFAAFHLYTMKQAIEEGFILDVLRNYITYNSYYEIIKTANADLGEEFEKSQAFKRLKSYVTKHPKAIEAKTEIIINHFWNKIASKLKGKAKAMIATENIEMAIKYYMAVKKKLIELGRPLDAIVAFSGEKNIDGESKSEVNLNGFSDIRKKFASDEYRILIVANKFLTGFDEPKLCAMYVDKTLRDVQAVQALSRLNRTAPQYGKRSEDLCVLDFKNKIDDIKTAFEPFYAATTLKEATDVNVLHDLKSELDASGIYTENEINEFCELYFNGAQKSELEAIIDSAAQRFNADLELDENEKADYKIKAKQFVKIYSQVAQILPYEMPEWEKLFWFLKYLILKMIVRADKDEFDEILNSAELSKYVLTQKGGATSIKLSADGGELAPQNPNPRSAHGNEQIKDTLEEIIKEFNDRWSSELNMSGDEIRVKIMTLKNNIINQKAFKSNYLSTPSTDKENRINVAEEMLAGAMMEDKENILNMYKKYRNDEEFKVSLLRAVMEIIDKGDNIGL